MLSSRAAILLVAPDDPEVRRISKREVPRSPTKTADSTVRGGGLTSSGETAGRRPSRQGDRRRLALSQSLGEQDGVSASASLTAHRVTSGLFAAAVSSRRVRCTRSRSAGRAVVALASSGWLGRKSAYNSLSSAKALASATRTVVLTTRSGRLEPARSTASRFRNACRACSPNVGLAGCALSGSTPG